MKFEDTSDDDDSGVGVAVGIGLASQATLKGVRTRRVSYLIWAIAGLMLLMRGITGRPLFFWISIAGIIATIALQWFELRPMTGTQLMSRLQKEVERDERREARRRRPD